MLLSRSALDQDANPKTREPVERGVEAWLSVTGNVSSLKEPIAKVHERHEAF